MGGNIKNIHITGNKTYTKWRSNMINQISNTNNSIEYKVSDNGIVRVNKDRKSMFHYILGIEDEKAELKKEPAVIFEMSSERLSFYKENYKDARALMDTINFAKCVVGACSDGYFHFGNDGMGQIIPKSAIPRINVASLEKIGAKNGVLNLTSNTYYAYKAIDGKSYALAFNGNNLKRAFTESVLGDDMNNVATECRGNTVTTTHVISALARGTIGDLFFINKKDIRKSLENVGIKPGEFSIVVDGKERKYYLGESGRVRTEADVKERIKVWNERMWLDPWEVWDKVTLFGKEYEIDETGHIHIQEDDFWYGEECSTS